MFDERIWDLLIDCKISKGVGINVTTVVRNDDKRIVSLVYIMHVIQLHLIESYICILFVYLYSPIRIDVYSVVCPLYEVRISTPGMGDTPQG